MLHLALIDQVFDRARHVFDRDVGIDSMLVQQIDRIDSEPSERGVNDLPDVLGATVQTALRAPIGVKIETELGCEHDPPAEGSEGFSHKLFIRELTVGFGGIEECDSPLDKQPSRISLIPSCLLTAGP